MIEQFQVDLHWQERWVPGLVIDPLVSRVAACMTKGGHVRMILDSTWFNLESNKDVTDYLGSIASNGTLRGEFKLMDPNSPITVVHNKGVLFDGIVSMISSNNWGSSSFASNRELTALVESREVAWYFCQSFDMDWTPDETPPEADAGTNLELPLGTSLRLDGSGSSDDRAIISWSWDTDGDGEANYDGEVVEVYPTVPGRIRISLTVKDSWGNSDTDTVTIDIVEQELGRKYRNGMEIAEALACLFAGCAGALFGVVMARRSRRPPRKINQEASD
jgi:hypothetical protein